MREKGPTRKDRLIAQYNAANERYNKAVIAKYAAAQEQTELETILDRDYPGWDEGA